MATQITIPTTADLPKDWHSTAFGLVTAIVTLVTAYFKNGGEISWQVALAAVAVAVICYFIPAKVSQKDQLTFAVNVEKLVADTLAKNIPAAVADGEAMVALVTKTVLATLSAQQAIALPGVSAGQPALTPSPAPENATGAILGASGAAS